MKTQTYHSEFCKNLKITRYKSQEVQFTVNSFWISCNYKQNGLSKYVWETTHSFRFIGTFGLISSQGCHCTIQIMNSHHTAAPLYLQCKINLRHSSKNNRFLLLAILDILFWSLQRVNACQLFAQSNSSIKWDFGPLSAGGLLWVSRSQSKCTLQLWQMLCGDLSDFSKKKSVTKSFKNELKGTMCKICLAI